MGGSVGATGLTILGALRGLAVAGLLALAVLSMAPQRAAAQVPPGCTLAPSGFSAKLTCNSSGVTVSCSGSYITFACTASGLCSGTVTGFVSGSIVTVTGNSLACTSASTLTAAAVARQASQAGMSAVQGQITTIR